ncbi:hypothetical protein ACIQ6Y_33190 [Streptomyces sp. NPDC096205]|uniref:hypothetical protein n=1 Tax=Streptomyces sp. NPDC096205 TaxID=3366081 RepID=UPI0038099BB2
MTTEWITDTGDDSYVCRIKDITLTPAFPEPGKELRLDLTAELAEQVDLTQVECHFQVKLGLITPLRATYTLPDLLAAWGAELSGDPKPPAGEWKQSWIFKLPREIPKGDFRLYLTSYTNTEMDFLDLNARFDMRKQ